MGLVTLLTEPESFKFYRGKGYTEDPRNVSYNAGTPNNDGIMGNGAKSKPLVTTPIPSLTDAQNPKTLIDSLYRGQGVLTKSTLQDTQRISKFLISEQGIQFLAKNQALLLSQNIRQYGNDVTKWTYINPASYVENTALAPTGIGVRNTFTFGINPTFTREGTYGEPATFKNKAARIAADRAAKNTKRVDQITKSPMYLSTTGPKKDYLTDTVPFYIQKINNDGSGNNTYIHFRAYLTGLTDDFGADWKGTSYMGRGEQFYSYNGFSREMNFSLQVPVMSRDEQSAVYSKLNYLASLMAPDYTEGGFMRGNLVKITIGDYIIDLPGIIKGIGYDYDDEGGWDIARNDVGKRETDAYIMPKLINIKGIKFTPIHNFIPQTVSEAFIVSGSGKDVNAPFISFGKTGLPQTNTGGYYNSPQIQPAGPLTQDQAQAQTDANTGFNLLSVQG
jgi:hypothetical protein